MAVLKGSASNYLDLLAQLVTFLTTNSDLSGASPSQAWTLLASNKNSYTNGSDTVDAEYYLRAPGLSGAEQIYINLRAYHNVSGDYYNVECRGAVGYLASSAFASQPGSSPPVFSYLWNQASTSIPFWFIANGQRVIVIAKVGTIYETIYLGKISIYGTPAQYPMPLYIGATGINQSQRYSIADNTHRSCWDGNGSYLCNTDGSWLLFQNQNNYSSSSTPSSPNNWIWPWQYDQQQFPGWMTANYDGTYQVIPARLEGNNPSINVWGELDGVGFVTGYGNTAENTLTIGSDTWLVVPNVYRSSANNYAAIKLS